jgi:medium-chain acyl-[acyl-carrier-protein] hydrolase
LLAFEVGRALVRRGDGKPVHLFVSGRRGPRFPEPASPIHGLDEAALLREVGARYGPIPDAVLREPELLQMLLPALRADLEGLETYVYNQEDLLDCPITALGGVDDPWATAPELEAWRHETTGAFSLRRFAGGHFYLKDEEPLVLEEIRSRFASLATPVSAWGR